MRKINENDFVDYTFSEDGFSITLTNLKQVVNIFNSRAHGTITGRKITGDTAILDQK